MECHCRWFVLFTTPLACPVVPSTYVLTECLVGYVNFYFTHTYNISLFGFFVFIVFWCGVVAIFSVSHIIPPLFGAGSRNCTKHVLLYPCIVLVVIRPYRYLWMVLWANEPPKATSSNGLTLHVLLAIGLLLDCGLLSRNTRFFAQVIYTCTQSLNC